MGFEWVVSVGAAGRVAVLNGLAQAAGRVLPAPGRAVARAVLLTGNAAFQAGPGDGLRFVDGPLTCRDCVGTTTVREVAPVSLRGQLLLVHGKEPDEGELAALASLLGLAGPEALLAQWRAVGDFEGVVACW